MRIELSKKEKQTLQRAVYKDIKRLPRLNAKIILEANKGYVTPKDIANRLNCGVWSVYKYLIRFEQRRIDGLRIKKKVKQNAKS